MTYCSKEDCKFGICFEHHILNKKDYEKNPYKEDLSKDTTVCVLAHYKSDN
jgi:hypothetical protein